MTEGEDPVSRRREWLWRHRHRAVLAVSGPAGWARRQACELVSTFDGRRLWVGESCPVPDMASCKGAQAHQWLGRELDLVVWDSHCGTHPAGLAAISGALVGGGLLLWLVPPLSEWAWYEDGDYQRLRRHHPPYLFLERLGRLLSGPPFPHGVITPDTPLPPGPKTPEHLVSVRPDGPTDDQRQAIESLERMARDEQPRPLVLRADRGRGKSAALGMAAARLAHEQGLRIVVTAPRPSALESFWRFAGESPGMSYQPPDELLRHCFECDFLFVDEAAALPVPVLLELLEKAPRVVFATTVHGYEGSGRGFDLRFRDFLDERRPGWQLLRMNEPVRWAQNDPLEHLIDRLLCLDADLTAEAPEQEPIRIERLDREQLARNEALLGQVMGLLVSAHYQTSPDDLRQLLDDPDSALWGAFAGAQLVAVGWVLLEGGLEPELAEAVWLGRRRPRGHLMAQSLAFHGGDPAAARLKYARITRIAVHPRLRRQRVGGRLIEAIRENLLDASVDVLGVSFGVTEELLPFWQTHGFQLLRLGLRRDPASGTHAAMLGVPLTEAGEQLCWEQSQRFAQHWPFLAGYFQALSMALRGQLESMLPEVSRDTPGSSITRADQRELEAFSRGYRGLELSRLPLGRLSRIAPEPESWSDSDRTLWQSAVVAGRPLAELQARQVIQGRREALARLRKMTEALMTRNGNVTGSVSLNGVTANNTRTPDTNK